MIKLVSNYLEGKFAAPNHPITCANPAPWLITEVRIDRRYDFPHKSANVLIRGRESMWFNVNDCYISDYDDCMDHLEVKEHQRKLNSLYFSYEV